MIDITVPQLPGSSTANEVLVLLAIGVTGFLHIPPADRVEDVMAQCVRNADVWATVCVHPHEADAHPESGGRARRRQHTQRVIFIGDAARLALLYEAPGSTEVRSAIEAASRQAALVVHTLDARTRLPKSLAAPSGRGASPVCPCFTDRDLPQSAGSRFHSRSRARDLQARRYLQTRPGSSFDRIRSRRIRHSSRRSARARRVEPPSLRTPQPRADLRRKLPNLAETTTTTSSIVLPAAA